MFADPTNDNYLDGINYRAFSAMFAGILSSVAATSGVSYIKKHKLKKAEMKPVNIANKSKSKSSVLEVLSNQYWQRTRGSIKMNALSPKPQRKRRLNETRCWI